MKLNCKSPKVNAVWTKQEKGLRIRISVIRCYIELVRMILRIRKIGTNLSIFNIKNDRKFSKYYAKIPQTTGKVIKHVF